MNAVGAVIAPAGTLRVSLPSGEASVPPAGPMVAEAPVPTVVPTPVGTGFGEVSKPRTVVGSPR